MKRFLSILCCILFIVVVKSCGSLRYTSSIILKHQDIDSTIVKMVDFEVPFPAKWDTLWVGNKHMTKTWFIQEGNKVKHQFTINELDTVNIIMYRRLR